MEQKMVLVAVLAILVIFLILFIPKFVTSQQKNKNNAEIPVQVFKNTKPETFKGVMVQAEAVYVWDVIKGRVLYEKNSEEILPLASLTKLMTALVATESGISENVQITPEALFEDGEYGLYAYQTWNRRDLLDFSLIESSNDAIKALASASLYGANEDDFVSRMNSYTQKLNLKKTSFQNETGLDIEEVSNGGYSTAREISIIMKYILESHPDLLEATKESKLRFYAGGLTYEAKNTNPYTGQISGLLASKTGFTDLSGGNLSVILDVGLNRPIIITVLGSSYDGRFTDVLQLARATVEYLEEE